MNIMYITLAIISLVIVCCCLSLIVGLIIVYNTSTETPTTLTETPTTLTETPSTPIEQPEVYFVGNENQNSIYNISQDQSFKVAQLFGGVVASLDQLKESQLAGADWCATGWLSNGTCKYPITTRTQTGCGSGKTGIMDYIPSSRICGVNIYGVKPKTDITLSGYRPLPFNQSKWSQFS